MNVNGINIDLTQYRGLKYILKSQKQLCVLVWGQWKIVSLLGFFHVLLFRCIVAFGFNH